MPAGNPWREPCWLGRALCLPLSKLGGHPGIATMCMASAQIIVGPLLLATIRGRDWAARTPCHVHDTFLSKIRKLEIRILLIFVSSLKTFCWLHIW